VFIDDRSRDAAVFRAAAPALQDFVAAPEARAQVRRAGFRVAASMVAARAAAALLPAPVFLMRSWGDLRLSRVSLLIVCTRDQSRRDSEVPQM
jgi:hypothetical protein